MINRTSLNRTFLAKVRAAAHEAIGLAARKGQGQAYVTNRRGKLMMRVDYQYGRQPALRFWEQSRRDVTPLITEALGGLL